MLSSDEIRRSYVDFFTSRGHTEIPGASLIGDSTVLFTSAGMQPLIPYFGGAPHPSGRRLVNVQRCLRTVDIDQVGDDRHLTCFEMLGNWSLGDYYKHESLGWTLEWLLSIGRSLRSLPQHNVDVGLGLERIACLLQGVDSVYDTDLFSAVRSVVRGLARVRDERAARIVCDHVRSSVLLVRDGVLPSNTEHGYVLRRLLRRAIRQGRMLGIDGPFLREVGRSVLDEPSLLDVLEQEERRFAGTLRRGLRELSRLSSVDGRELFRLFETYGLPPELTLEELGVPAPGWEEEYSRARDEHRERSRTSG